MLMAYLTLKNASDVIPRCTKPFEVKELVGVEVPQGTVGHAERVKHLESALSW